MQRQSVESSSLASVGYEEWTRTLEVEFRNGGVYRYLGVPAAVHHALMTADSRGAYLNTRIKPYYPYQRVQPPEGRAAAGR
jgi:KTSC domain